MKIQPLISIIVPVYNSELYIEECISSILRLNLNKEIIIVDDGSTDLTLKKLEQFSNKPEIKLIQQLHGGVSSARNIGLLKSVGDYIGFVDSDDTINVEQFELLVALFIRSDADMAMGGTNMEFPNGKIEQRKAYNHLMNSIISGQRCFAQLLQGDSFIPFAVNYIFRKEFLNKINIQFKYLISEDDLWVTMTMCQANHIFVSNIIHYNYLVHRGSLTTSNIDTSFKADNLLGVAKSLYLFSEQIKLCAETKVWLYCKILYTFSAAIQIYKTNGYCNYNISSNQIKEITKYVLSFTDMKAKRIAITYYYRIMYLINSTNNEANYDY
ncbi:MAG: glycosyltransferase [Muribaculaceae bacterium]|nr:glycosyltransferase [Muribaculaceae bacterium]